MYAAGKGVISKYYFVLKGHNPKTSGTTDVHCFIAFSVIPTVYENHVNVWFDHQKLDFLCFLCFSTKALM